MIIDVTAKEDDLICDNFLAKLIIDQQQYDIKNDPSNAKNHYLKVINDKENTISLNLCKSLGFTIGAQVDNKYLLTCRSNK